MVEQPLPDLVGSPDIIGEVDSMNGAVMSSSVSASGSYGDGGGCGKSIAPEAGGAHTRNWAWNN
jgi:hypothetical protein